MFSCCQRMARHSHMLGSGSKPVSCVLSMSKPPVVFFYRVREHLVSYSWVCSMHKFTCFPEGKVTFWSACSWRTLKLFSTHWRYRSTAIQQTSESWFSRGHWFCRRVMSNRFRSNEPDEGLPSSRVHLLWTSAYHSTYTIILGNWIWNTIWIHPDISITITTTMTPISLSDPPIGSWVAGKMWDVHGIDWRISTMLGPAKRSRKNEGGGLAFNWKPVRRSRQK